MRHAISMAIFLNFLEILSIVQLLRRGDAHAARLDHLKAAAGEEQGRKEEQEEESSSAHGITCIAVTGIL
jgi:hypothetical protein